MTALHWSTLREVAVSPRHARWRADHPRADTPALALGRAVHCAVLEPERWARDYRREPEWGDLRTRGAKEARAAWRADLPLGAVTLSAEQHALAEICASSVRAHVVAAELLRAGRAEVTLEWLQPHPRTGREVECAGRLDWIDPNGRVLDLKTTRHTSLRAIEADLARYLYHGQIAWYRQGAGRSGACPPDAAEPVLVVVQTVEPYDCVCLRTTQPIYAAGMALVDRLLATWLDCAEAGWWPGLAPGMLDWELPRWADEAEVSASGEEQW